MYRKNKKVNLERVSMNNNLVYIKSKKNGTVSITVNGKEYEDVSSSSLKRFLALCKEATVIKYRSE